MNRVKQVFHYFTKAELILWSSSVLMITVFFCIFDRENFLTLGASIIGITALIYNAKGNPFGQALIILFSAVYGYISFTFRYYGEMLTYLGMSAPMAIIALISWLRNPFKGNKAEVTVNRISVKEALFMFLASIVVTIVFYFILKFFGTANLLPSTLSVTTSFIAAYLTFRRSPFFALAYAVNDVVLLILWGYASLTDISYLSVLICFIAFLVNDLYGFYNWRRMEKRQRVQYVA